ncbi:hypothetical protein SAMN05216418_1470 [Microbacterium enclense]|uniref:Uncharacterized protein n=2 Tax=Microbacterium enclense TaxID=993073 RepID=A0A1G6ICR0_9MICO|nr:hypothetical protein SAMN05216418_1470 [Microbacterium enclense]
MTKDQQVRKVVAGLALGVLANGVGGVTSGKTALEFAFHHAWDQWGWASRFPAIGGHDPGNMFWIGMGRSASRQGGYGAWESGRMVVPYVKITSWTVDEALEAHAESDTDGVPTEAWVELGRLFVEYFEPQEVDHS